MVDKWIRLLIVSMMFAGLVAGSLHQGLEAEASEAGGFSASSAVLIGSTGQYIGAYSLSEPPGYPAADCVGHGVTVDMYAPDYIFVSPSNYIVEQKAEIIPVVYQRLANGSYSKFTQGGVIPVALNLNGPVGVSVPTAFSALPIGPDYLYAFHIEWKRKVDSYLLGSVDVANTVYHRTIDGKELPNGSVCGGLRTPSVVPSATVGTVNALTTFTLQYFPTKAVVPITWDGNQIGSVTTGQTSFADGSFVVPAAPMGPHTVLFKYGHWSAKVIYTVKPRIKLLPSAASRGQTVNVSLRGYAKYETVRIRWKKGASWVQLATVKTSGTGSASVSIKVPTWAPNGAASVRGDSVNATGGHAQTNAVTVSGGAPLTSSTVKTPAPTLTATPTKSVTVTKTPTPAATSTPSPQATAVPATPSAIATAPVETSTPEPTSSPETSTPAPSPTATAELVETPSPTGEFLTPVLDERQG